MSKPKPDSSQNKKYQDVSILISGGHLTPAVATIEYLQKNYPQIKIVFVGREYSQQQEEQLAKEREVCEQLGIPFYSLDAAKFHRSAWWRNIYELPQLIPSFWQAYRIIKQENIKLFISFGGYLAVPVAVVSRIMGKKIVTHEQTKSTGLANELIAVIANKVAVSHSESLSHFPQHKTVITGNPIREKLLRKYTKPPSWLKKSSKPILYITGGSQGSQTINNVVSQILDKLTSKFVVIHQVGRSANQRYLHTMQESASLLTPTQKERYYPKEWIDEQEVSWIMQNAVLAISRSGANTTFEMTLHALPAVFIPLPFAYNNEQWKNAQELVQAEAAILLEQREMTPQSLWNTVQEASSKRSHMSKRAQKLRDSLNTQGAKNLVELSLSLLPSK